jgi:Transposase.
MAYNLPLREVSLRPRRPIRVPRLTQRHHAARLLFARSHVNWQLREWRPGLFTDESRFLLTQRDVRVPQRVCRSRSEEYMPNAVQEGDRFRQDSVMVWDGISI